MDAKKYPAHLHIDILPEAQHKGYGTKLMDALMDYLAEKGVKGVHLGVGGDNAGGIRFYEKYGFTMIHDFGSFGKVFAKEVKRRYFAPFRCFYRTRKLVYAQYTRVFGTCKEPQKSIKFSPF